MHRQIVYNKSMINFLPSFSFITYIWLSYSSAITCVMKSMMYDDVITANSAPKLRHVCRASFHVTFVSKKEYSINWL